MNATIGHVLAGDQRAVMNAPVLLTPADLDANPWAYCGPAALAALIQRPLPALREHFALRANTKGRSDWVNLAMMKQAIHSLGAIGLSFEETRPGGLVPGTTWRERAWPLCGLVQIQFRGSWDTLGPMHPAQFERSHWIATVPAGHHLGATRSERVMVFDVNAVDDTTGCPGGWMTRETWETRMVPYLVRGLGKSASGALWVRAGLEVRL